jgi:hypothetical protein
MSKTIALVLLACLGACSDSTPDAGAAQSNATAGDLSYTLTDVDETCEGVAGLTATAVIRGVSSTYSTTFTKPSGAGSSGLTVGFAFHPNGAIRCTPSTPRACACDDHGCESDCGNDPPNITVQMDVTFKTADGTFDEQFTAPVLFDGQNRTWRGVVPGNSMKGTFAFTLGHKEREQVSFFGSVSTGATSGGVDEVDPQVASSAAGTFGN